MLGAYSFNQDVTCVAVGRSSGSGFDIYDIDPIQLRYRGQDSEIDVPSKADANGHSIEENDSVKHESFFGICDSIGIIEMLYCTSLIAIVGSGVAPGSSPRYVEIRDIY